MVKIHKIVKRVPLIKKQYKFGENYGRISAKLVKLGSFCENYNNNNQSFSKKKTYCTCQKINSIKTNEPVENSASFSLHIAFPEKNYIKINVFYHKMRIFQYFVAQKHKKKI
jgi:hypothetical protein